MDKELFKQMFDEFCENEINDGNCGGFYGCANCPVNEARVRIFWEDEVED